MREIDIKRISKFLSLVLRHNPGKIGIDMDVNGWVEVNDLIEKCAAKHVRFNKEELEEVVATNDKKRFSFNEDGTKLRANQGHSLAFIEMDFEVVEPPQFLYHGTVGKFMEAIQESGLQKMNRQHVHLSKDKETAIKVAKRRGKPVILTIQSGKMHQDGFDFHCSANGVWLTNEVPPKYFT